MSREKPVDIEWDDSPTQKVLNTVSGEVDKSLQDRIAGALGEMIVMQYKQALTENGSVVTGTGLESINTRHAGTGTYEVVTAGYLDQVDKGSTAAERKPIEINDRLYAAAEQYERIDNVVQLVNILDEKGTEAHPFKERALDRVRGDMQDLIEAEVAKTMQKALNSK